MNEYYRVELVNPFNKKIDLDDVITIIGTPDMIKDWSLGVIDIQAEIIPHYILNYDRVMVIENTIIIEENKEMVVTLPDDKKVKIVYSFLEYELVKYELNGNQMEGFNVKSIKNLAKKTADGMIPLDKQDKYNFVTFKNHNKRKLIKRGVYYIHNQLAGTNIIIDSFSQLIQGLTNG